VSLHERRDRRQLDRIVLADRLGGQIGGQRGPTGRAFVGTMINRAIECLARRPAMTFMSRLRAAGT
jgi:hypothetical protein